MIDVTPKVCIASGDNADTVSRKRARATIRKPINTYPKDQYGEVKLLIRPYEKIAPGTIVLTAWNWIDDLPSYDAARVKAFMDAHLNKCCEQVR